MLLEMHLLLLSYLLLLHLLLIHLSWMLHLPIMIILGGQPLNTARNVPDVEMKFEDVENYMVEKAKKESLDLV